jgi:hypothetical protein
MKTRKAKDIKSVLQRKGFVLEPLKAHHNFYYLNIDGKKHDIYTYLSHGLKEYAAVNGTNKKADEIQRYTKSRRFF